MFCTICFVSSLNFLQNSIMLMPRGPSACPIAGPGFAVPAGTRIRTVRTNDIFCGLYAVATELSLQSRQVAKYGFLSLPKTVRLPSFALCWLLSLLFSVVLRCFVPGGGAQLRQYRVWGHRSLFG